MRAGSAAGAATVLIAEGIASWYAVESRWSGAMTVRVPTVIDNELLAVRTMPIW